VLLLLAWTPTGLGAASTRATEIAVITGNPPPRIAADRQSLGNIFLKRLRVDEHGLPLVPLNLPPDSALRRAFSSSLLGRSPRTLAQYWNERYFHGVSPPYVVRSEEAMVRFVAATPGAVGYVMACRVDDRVRVLARLPVPPAYLDTLADDCPGPR